MLILTWLIVWLLNNHPALWTTHSPVIGTASGPTAWGVAAGVCLVVDLLVRK